MERGNSMPTQFEVWTKIVIPLTTFALGALVTYLVQKYWRRRDAVTESARTLAELTADWYNQLEELRKSLKQAAKQAKAADLVDCYVRNRLILPKILYHLAVLREHDAYPGLVSQVEEFLCMVTTYDRLATAKSVSCKSHLTERFSSLLLKLDEHQQAVARQAARIGGV
jgi:hypothetical protein